MTNDPITRLNAALEGRYRVEREIGEGGMAVVYLPHDERHNRNVALKVGRTGTILALVLGAGLAACGGQAVGGDADVSRADSLHETTIRAIHDAFASGTLSCQQLVEHYLRRIEAYDDQGPELNAILTVNSRALETAREMDRLYAVDRTDGRPLHCIPVIVKDNYDTADMPTTGGSVALAQSVPPDDAFVVRRLREAGALILAKSNLTELARGGTTISSLGGQTRNPYDLSRTPGGSSGGTGAAIAADFGLLGTGSDTGQSIRSPASAQSLVGIRATRGLVSRDGIIPISFTQDEVGADRPHGRRRRTDARCDRRIRSCRSNHGVQHGANT